MKFHPLSQLLLTVVICFALLQQKQLIHQLGNKPYPYLHLGNFQLILATKDFRLDGRKVVLMTGDGNR